MPLAPLFSPAAAAAPPPTATETHDNNDNAVPGAREGVCAEEEEDVTPASLTAKRETPPEAVLRGFQQALEACRVGTARAGAMAAAKGGEASKSTLRLLDLLLKEGMLDRVRSMFAVSGGVDSDGGSGAAAAAELGEEESTASLVARPMEEQEWSRCVVVATCLFEEERAERLNGSYGQVRSMP